MLLVKTDSEYNVEGKRAEIYSRDKKKWAKFPEEISVIGSRYALLCEDLIPCDFELDLEEYEIAIGESKGKVLHDYFRGRVDKACAIKTKYYKGIYKVKVSWYARVIDAVFVRGD